MFYEGLYLCHKTGVNTARTLYFDWCDSVEVLTIQEKNKIYKIY